MDKLEEHISQTINVKRKQILFQKSLMQTNLETFTENIDPKYFQAINSTKKDAKKAINCLIFGFIGHEIESKYNLTIPFYLKCRIVWKYYS